MARQELGPAALRVAQAVAAVLPPGECIVGCSGGADSWALALGAQWAGRRTGTEVRAMIIDHGLQSGSAEVAQHTRKQLAQRGIPAEVVRVEVDTAEGVEAGAREARLSALSAPGLPVLLGHTLDDQAESVLLGLLRGSGARSLSGMAQQRDHFLRPLLTLRRSDTQQACREWAVRVWDDPMNSELDFARVRARKLLQLVSEELGRDVAISLARTADLLRADADYLGQLAQEAVPEVERLSVRQIASLPSALRGRTIHRFLAWHGVEPNQTVVNAVEALILRWRGQGPVSVTGGRVYRRAGQIFFDAVN